MGIRDVFFHICGLVLDLEVSSVHVERVRSVHISGKAVSCQHDGRGGLLRQGNAYESIGSALSAA